MNILMISGSRNPEGQTAQAAGVLLEGASEAGIEGEMIFLPQLNIERCRQCDDDGYQHDIPHQHKKDPEFFTVEACS